MRLFTQEYVSQGGQRLEREKLLTVTETKRNTSQRPDQTDELVEIARSSPCDSGTPNDNRSPETVLLPLDFGRVFARSRENAVLHNSDSGEELKRSREKDSEGVEELCGVDEFVILREIDENDSLKITEK